VQGNLRFPLTLTYHGCPRFSHVRWETRNAIAGYHLRAVYVESKLAAAAGLSTTDFYISTSTLLPLDGRIGSTPCFLAREGAGCGGLPCLISHARCHASALRGPLRQL